jgi:hypothetical protein
MDRYHRLKHFPHHLELHHQLRLDGVVEVFGGNQRIGERWLLAKAILIQLGAGQNRLWRISGSRPIPSRYGVVLELPS